MELSQKNKNLLFSITGILAILGLIFVQIYLLRTGILFEKDRLDQKMAYLMRKAAIEISENKGLRAGISTLYKKKDKELKLSEKNLPRMLTDSLYYLLKEKLISQDVEAQFTFALLQRQSQDILIASPSYEQEAKSSVYQAPLTGKIQMQCHCALQLEVQLNNLYSYLLRRLSLLIILSIFFTGLLILSLALLISSTSKLKKLNDLKNDFINNLTHELKTPLFSISLISKILGENIKKGDKEKSQELLGLLKKENDQIKLHTEKVLELASLESGNYQLELSAVDIHQLLAKLKDEFIFKLEEKEGAIDLQLSAKNALINIDRPHFINALRNLLDNALKYADKKPVIQIKTSNIDQGLQISISDNGPGIPKQDQQRIFDKFYRIPSGNLHKVKGFGLGLSYVKRIVDLHGGTIQIKSEINKGSEFVLLLPIEVV